jgi:hypothetical protein
MKRKFIASIFLFFVFDPKTRAKLKQEKSIYIYIFYLNSNEKSLKKFIYSFTFLDKNYFFFVHLKLDFQMLNFS